MDKQKIIIFLGVFLGLLAVFGAAFFFFSHSDKSSFLKEKEKEKTYEENLGIFIEEELKKAKAKTDVQFVEGDLEVFEAPTEESCSKESGQERENCLTSLELSNVLYNGKVEDCNSFEGAFKDFCILRLAESSGDHNNCFNIESSKVEEFCLSNYANYSNDSSLCDLFDDEHEATECRDRVIAMNQGSLLSGEEEDILDIAVCNDVGTLEYFNQCVLRNDAPCEGLGDPEKVAQCQSIRYFSSLIVLGERENCSLLPMERYEKACELFFDNGKVFPDTDGDGLTDNKELWFDTDPFTADEVASGLEKEGFDPLYFEAVNSGVSMDLDQDGLSDLEELKLKTDPSNQDTDGDGFSDGEEVKNGFDPLVK